jgi:hypothetical protein
MPRLLVAVFILLIAAFFRLHQLDALPPALFHDEAVNGLDALTVLRTGQIPVFFTANNGREPLLIYLQTLSLALWGRQAFSMRLVSAFIGVITVAQVMGMTRSFWPQQPYRLALLAGLILAVGYWHVHFSRIAFRAILLLPLLNLTLWAFWRGWQRRRLRYFVLSGLAFGLTLYTYLPARLIPLIIFGWVAWMLFMNWRRLNGRLAMKPLFGGSMIMLLVGMVVFTPLGFYFVHHAADFSARTQQVSVLSISAAAGQPLPLVLLDHVWQTARLFIDQGHSSFVLNLPTRPILDRLSQAGLTLGLLMALWRWRQPLYPFLLLWLGVMLLPTILSNEPGHPLRAIGAITPVILLTAVGLGAAAEWVGRRCQRPRLAWVVVMTAVLLFTGFTTYRDYFRVWGRLPETVKAFHTPYERIAERLLALEKPAFITAEVFDFPTTQFALQAKLGEIDELTALPPEETAATLYPTYLCRLKPDMVLLNNKEAYFPPRQHLNTAAWLEADLALPLIDALGRPIALEHNLINYSLPARTAIWPHLIGHDFDLQWCALAFDIMPHDQHKPETSLQITVYWENMAETPVFIPVEVSLENSFGDILTSVTSPVVNQAPALGHVISQTYSLTLPETVVLPGKFRFRIKSLANDAHPIYPPLTLTDYVTLGQTDIQLADIPNPMDFAYGNPPRLRLLGYDMDRNAANLTLYWHSEQPVNKNYSVFVHLLDEQGKMIGQQDGEPGNGRLPTSMWLPGEFLVDSRSFTLPNTGSYTLAVGIYDWQTGERLPVADAFGHQLANDQAVISGP